MLWTRTRAKRTLIIVLIGLLLTSCATTEPESICNDAAPLPLVHVETAEWSNYWRPKRKRQVVQLPNKVAEAIATGRLAGFVVVEQTILTNGEVTDVNVMGYYPDEAVLDVYLEHPNYQTYIPVTCPVQPVRYRTVNYFSNGDKIHKQLEVIYRDYVQALDAAEAERTSPIL